MYESDPIALAGLDPDGDGTACPGLPSGFAPAFWTATLPPNLTLGTLDYVVDGDTFEITVNGQSNRYRLYRADTPEVGDAVECGGAAAADYVRYVVSFADTPGQVWVESVGQRDRYDRILAYIWFTVAGEPYLLNHVLINNGWAQDASYDNDLDPYRTQLETAASFAREHRLGVWSKCGGFGIPLPAPTPFPTQAPAVQPTQGPAMNLGGGGCDPNYAPCVPNVPYDLNCPDIGFSVRVIGYDRYGLDRDGDGYGCESYG